jgi:hypothetical protein
MGVLFITRCGENAGDGDWMQVEARCRSESRITDADPDTVAKHEPPGPLID